MNEELENEKKTSFKSVPKSAKTVRGGGFSVIKRYYKPMMVKSSRDLAKCVLINSRANKMLINNTENSTNSFSSDKKIMQMLNIITDSHHTVRPVTAITTTRPKQSPPVSQTRPMSARVRRSHFNKNNNKITTWNPKNYKRPISAAISTKLRKKSNRENPKRIKTKYLKYLKDLEVNANKFCIYGNYDSDRKSVV